jgi:hypothetical protein
MILVELLKLGAMAGVKLIAKEVAKESFKKGAKDTVVKIAKHGVEQFSKKQAVVEVTPTAPITGEVISNTSSAQLIESIKPYMTEDNIQKVLSKLKDINGERARIRNEIDETSSRINQLLSRPSPGQLALADTMSDIELLNMIEKRR